MKYTGNYIKMAQVAEEIQALRPAIPQPPPNLMESLNRGSGDDVIGALFWGDASMECLHFDNDETRWMIGGYHQDPDSFAWIPRLDDLVAMINGLDEYREIMESTIRTGAILYGLHEPILAWIMFKRYGKVWNGKAWALPPARIAP